MEVAALVELLRNLPQDRAVYMSWDGAARGSVDAAWVCRAGDVVLGEEGEFIREDEDRPEAAPREADESVWYPEVKGSRGDRSIEATRRRREVTGRMRSY
jgi:hypothetical protein